MNSIKVRYIRQGKDVKLMFWSGRTSKALLNLGTLFLNTEQYTDLSQSILALRALPELLSNNVEARQQRVAENIDASGLCTVCGEESDRHEPDCHVGKELAKLSKLSALIGLAEQIEWVDFPFGKEEEEA